MKKTTKIIAATVAVATALTVVCLPNKENKEVVYADTKDKEIEITKEQEEIYDVPLDDLVQEYLISEAHLRNLDPKLVLAVCSVESDFDMECISGEDYGIMQINRINHKRLEEKLELMDITDVYCNISAGCEMLYEIKGKYPDVHQMLMVYNMGEAGAKKCWERGIYSSKYSRKVLERMEKIERIY